MKIEIVLEQLEKFGFIDDRKIYVYLSTRSASAGAAFWGGAIGAAISASANKQGLPPMVLLTVKENTVFLLKVTKKTQFNVIESYELANIIFLKLKKTNFGLEYKYFLSLNGKEYFFVAQGKNKKLMSTFINLIEQRNFN